MGSDSMSAKVRDYMARLVPTRPAEMQAMEMQAEETKFPIIGPTAGYLCYQIARMGGAKRVFELGSGYGYSTAWFAKAVQENGGGVVHHAVWSEELSVQAQGHLTALGLGNIVQYHVGEAVQALREAPGSFDLIFNDIDKEGYPDSLPVISEKLRVGGILVVDNMFLGGCVFDENNRSPSTEGVRQFTHRITADPGWIVSIIPIRDGLLLAYKK